MSFLHKFVNSGVHFATSPSQRRSILLSNLVSLILFGLGTILFIAYYLWYGWSIITMAIPVITILCLATLLLNHLNFSLISRLWVSLLVPVLTMSLSLYSKNLYYAFQEELDYFTFRFIILGSCVFPAIFFSFRERIILFITSAAGLAILMVHDPLHTFFGVPYQKHVLTESNYAFTNVVILITYSLMMGAIFFLKWTSEKSEEKAEQLIQELNQTNEELLEKNYEIEAQNQEISAQSENLNISQDRLQKAYEMIAEQKNQLMRQNKSLSSELVDINKDLTMTNTELIKHNNELRQFSYTVSHNLRGPVASLIGLINLIDQRDLNDNNTEIYGHIQTSIRRLDIIISDLSKIIDIRQDIFHIRQKIWLQDEVNEILHGFKKEIESHQIQIKTDFSRCPEIYSVRPMVHSILFNLISNALKYKAHNRVPEIEISSRMEGGYTLFVKDNGLGINLKNHGQDLFKLYKRFHFHTEGKGLGLYLVKLQAEALGGRVDVTSEINRYSAFTVWLGQPDNVEQQILYQETFARIFFDARLDATGIVWKGPVSGNQYRTAFAKCLEFVKVYNTPNYIADLSEQGYISREDQLWMFQEILPEAAQYGLRRIAGIKPDNHDPLVAEYLKGITDNLRKLGIQQQYFSTLSEAMDWIQTENKNQNLSRA
jgi:signal transduction histidine kinase